MFSIKETTENGATKEMVFTNKSEAVEALRTLLGVEKTAAQKQAEQRQQLNDSLRAEFQRGRSTSNPQALIESARASNRWQGE